MNELERDVLYQTYMDINRMIVELIVLISKTINSVEVRNLYLMLCSLVDRTYFGWFTVFYLKHLQLSCITLLNIVKVKMINFFYSKVVCFQQTAVLDFS